MPEQYEKELSDKLAALIVPQKTKRPSMSGVFRSESLRTLTIGAHALEVYCFSFAVLSSLYLSNHAKICPTFRAKFDGFAAIV